MLLRDSKYTRMPYTHGTQLKLQICETHCDDLPSSQQVTVTIRKLVAITMSPVLEVTIPTPSGATIPAILKLYDRRHELEEERKTQLLPSRPEWFLEDDVEEPRLAKFEAALWQECKDNFDCETKAYARLEDLQGKFIPRMLAHVSLLPGEADIVVPPDLQHMASYFEVQGILLEFIDGYNLGDIAISPRAPSDIETVHRILQSAADAAHEIDRRGVLMKDASPRNAVVDRHSQVPYIVDFAQCYFKDELTQRWLASGWDEDEGWDPDVEYWERVSQKENPVAIGRVAAVYVKRARGVDLDIKVPDYDKIIADLERRKAARGEDDVTSDGGACSHKKVLGTTKA